jgi:hypothetical protein
MKKLFMITDLIRRSFFSVIFILSASSVFALELKSSDLTSLPFPELGKSAYRIRPDFTSKARMGKDR